MQLMQVELESPLPPTPKKKTLYMSFLIICASFLPISLNIPLRFHFLHNKPYYEFIHFLLKNKIKD